MEIRFGEDRPFVTTRLKRRMSRHPLWGLTFDKLIRKFTMKIHKVPLLLELIKYGQEEHERATRPSDPQASGSRRIRDQIAALVKQSIKEDSPTALPSQRGCSYPLCRKSIYAGQSAHLCPERA